MHRYMISICVCVCVRVRARARACVSGYVYVRVHAFARFMSMTFRNSKGSFWRTHEFLRRGAEEDRSYELSATYAARVEIFVFK